MRRIISNATIVFLLMTGVAFAAKPLVLFDQGHGQRFLIEKSGELHLSGLAAAFDSAGFEVRSTDQVVTPELLSGVKAYVSSGAFAPFSPEEAKALADFISSGGGLAVMIHIPQPYGSVFANFKTLTSSGAINETATESVIGSNPLNYSLRDLAEHPLFTDINELKVYGGWALLNADKNSKVIASTTNQAWIDINRDRKRDSTAEPLMAFGLVLTGAIEGGHFAIFGDDAIFQDRFLTGDNAKVADNLAKWLSE